MAKMVINHYEVLGLESGIEATKLTSAEITKAYRSKALKLHPDKRPNDPNAKIKFQALKSSFDILNNENSRRIFDNDLRRIYKNKQSAEERRRKMRADHEKEAERRRKMRADHEKEAERRRKMRADHEKEEEIRRNMIAEDELRRKKMMEDLEEEAEGRRRKIMEDFVIEDTRRLKMMEMMASIDDVAIEEHCRSWRRFNCKFRAKS